MKKQDGIFPRTPEAAVRESWAQLRKLSDSITLSVENGDTTASIRMKVGNREIPATIELKGLVTFANLQTAGQTKIDGGNIVSGTILADLIKAGVLKSKDEKSIVLDLDKGRADITGSVNLSGENEQGYLIGSLRPGLLQLVQTDPEGSILCQVQLLESGLLFTDPVSGNALRLALEDGKGKLSGLAAPEEDSDAVNKAYLEAYVWEKLDELRAELGLAVG